MKRGAGLAVAVVLGSIFLVGGLIFLTSGPSKLLPLAKCLKENGATFYGAFWCPHCQATKRMFGNSANELPYVECSTPDSKGQLQICKDKGIENYPTWEFEDGSRQTGELTAAQLAEASGCPLPQ